jgi:hypothetical protein
MEPFAMPILPMNPKLHNFGFQNYNTHPTQNDVILVINYIKKKKKKKRRRKSGVAPATPLAKMRWSDHPQKQKKKMKK